MNAGRCQAGCCADGAVDVSDDAARPADDVVMVISDAPFKQGRTAGRLDAAHQPGRGKRVEGLVDGLQGDMTNPMTNPGSDRLDVQVSALPDGLEQRRADGGYPQADTTQLLGGTRRLRGSHPGRV